MAAGKIVRIGGASGFWGDSRVAAPQLVASGAVDYLVFDYLAETTMAILAAARLKRPELGYATDFVDVAMRPVLHDIAERGIKVVSNAGGIHPRACVAALEAVIAAEGLALKVAVVEGDDVSAQIARLAAAGTRDIDRGDALPGRVLSANAYLGAMPIAAALAAGADIVVTGRVVDSALALGPLVHEFGWRAGDHDVPAGAISRANSSSARRSAWSATTRSITSRLARVRECGPYEVSAPITSTWVAVKAAKPAWRRRRLVRSRIAAPVRSAFFTASMPTMTSEPAQRKPASAVAETL